MCRSHTINNKECIADGVNDGLDCSNAGDPAMKVVISSKVPSGKPHENVIPHAKEPNERKVGK